MPLARLVMLAPLMLLAACATEQQRRAQKNEAIKAQAAQEIRRICALPESEREAEVERIKKESGMVIYCGNK
jgi:uncharacterized lipoprotein YajG